jgi:hypothetical protein
MKSENAAEELSSRFGWQDKLCLAELSAASAVTKPEFLTTDDTDTTDQRGPVFFIRGIREIRG